MTDILLQLLNTQLPGDYTDITDRVFLLSRFVNLQHGFGNIQVGKKWSIIDSYKKN